MGKRTITAAIYGGNGKKEHGIVDNFRLENGQVMVDFSGPKTDSKPVEYKKLHFPHHKAEMAAQTAAQALKGEEIAEFFPAD